MIKTQSFARLLTFTVMLLAITVARADEPAPPSAERQPQKTQVVQRISSPRPLKELAVIAGCYAYAPNLGGSITLSVAPRQGAPRWSTTTQGQHNGPLQLKIPAEELAGMRDFDVHVRLSSSSGVEQGDKACATLNRIRVDAR